MYSSLYTKKKNRQNLKPSSLLSKKWEDWLALERKAGIWQGILECWECAISVRGDAFQVHSLSEHSLCSEFMISAFLQAYAILYKKIYFKNKEKYKYRLVTRQFVRTPSEQIGSPKFQSQLLPDGSDSKNNCLQCRRPGFTLWVGKIPWRTGDTH